jgi:hypothetical protein
MGQFFGAIPWWLLIAILLAGAAMVVHGNQRGQAPVRSAGLLVICLGLLLGAARFLFPTNAERMASRTRQIVQCASDKNWSRMQGLLDADTRVDLAGHWPSAAGAANICKDAQTIAQKVKLTSVYLWGLKSRQTGPRIVVTFTAYTRQEATQDSPYPSDWEFDYLLRGNRWDLSQITLTNLDGQ